MLATRTFGSFHSSRYISGGSGKVVVECAKPSAASDGPPADGINEGQALSVRSACGTPEDGYIQWPGYIAEPERQYRNNSKVQLGVHTVRKTTKRSMVLDRVNSHITEASGHVRSMMSSAGGPVSCFTDFLAFFLAIRS